MANLLKSPFKANRIETDPRAFGLRPKEIVDSTRALLNDKSVLISGPRGIGKSSLGEQIQTIMKGNNILLKRCHIDSEFPKTLCVYYACGPDISLEQLIRFTGNYNKPNDSLTA